MKVADCIGDYEDFKKSSKNIGKKTKELIILLTLPYQG